MFSWNSHAFSMIQRMLAIWSLVPRPFLNPAWTSGISRFPYCWSLPWRILSITLLACEMSAIVYVNWDYSVPKRLFLNSCCQDPRTCSDFCPLQTCVFCFPFSSVTYLHILNKYLLCLNELELVSFACNWSNLSAIRTFRLLHQDSKVEKEKEISELRKFSKSSPILLFCRQSDPEELSDLTKILTLVGIHCYMKPTAHALQEEKPLQWEVHALQLESSPYSL